MSLMFKRAAQYLLPAVLLMVGCSEQEPDSISVVDASGEAVTIIYATPTEATYSVNVVAGSWSVTSSDVSWCIPLADNGGSGDVLDIFVKDFTENSSSRSAFVTFVSGMASQTIMVVQSSDDNFVNLFPGSSSIDYTEQDVQVSVASNFDNWTAASSAAWATATADVENGILTLEVEENEYEEERVATIYIMFDNSGASLSGTTSAEFVLTQSGRSKETLDLNVYSYIFPTVESVKGDLELAIEAETTLYKPTYKVSSSATWCKVSDDDAAKFTIEVDPNYDSKGRAAVVTVIATSEDGASTLMKTIEVEQEGVEAPYVTFDQLLYSYECAGESVSIPFFSSEGTLSVTVNDSKSMITSADAKDGKLTFTLAENASITSRTATIEVKITTDGDNTTGGETASQTITIEQAGYETLDLALSYYDIEIAAAGETITVSATSSTGSASLVEWSCTGATSITAMGASTAVKFPANINTRESVTYLIRAELTENGQTIVRYVNVTQVAASDVVTDSSSNVSLLTLSVSPETSNITATANQTVPFTATTNGTESLVAWSCDDKSVTFSSNATGATSTATFPENTSGAVKTYTVTATITDKVTGSDVAETKTVSVTVEQEA